VPEPRLTAKVWSSAYIRRCQVQAVPAMVARHGDDTAGMVLVKINSLGKGCAVYQPTSDIDGKRNWLRATGQEMVAEADADAYIDRQVSYDPDLWVIEVEDQQCRHFLDEPIVDI
jgi:hypothetical protein